MPASSFYHYLNIELTEYNRYGLDPNFQDRFWQVRKLTKFHDLEQRMKQAFRNV